MALDFFNGDYFGTHTQQPVAPTPPPRKVYPTPNFPQLNYAMPQAMSTLNGGMQGGLTGGIDINALRANMLNQAQSGIAQNPLMRGMGTPGALPGMNNLRSSILNSYLNNSGRQY